MDSTVTLIATGGPLTGHKFVFAEPATCLIGRSCHCTITLPQVIECLDVSRQHCLLDIAPPSLRVRDLGSLNGTYVNGKKIGQRAPGEETGQVEASPQPTVALLDGDEIRLGGHTAFRVCSYSVEDEDTKRATQRSSCELHLEEPVPS